MLSSQILKMKNLTVDCRLSSIPLLIVVCRQYTIVICLQSLRLSSIYSHHLTVVFTTVDGRRLYYRRS